MGVKKKNASRFFLLDSSFLTRVLSMMNKIVLFMLTVLFGAFMFAQAPVLAQNVDEALGLSVGDSSLSEASGLTDNDVRITVANIIKVALSLLGTITLVLIVYAGFLWMTAAGNDDQIGKAKGIIGAAVVGLIIILSAYAITNFLVSNIATETGFGAAG